MLGCFCTPGGSRVSGVLWAAEVPLLAISTWPTTDSCTELEAAAKRALYGAFKRLAKAHSGS